VKGPDGSDHPEANPVGEEPAGRSKPVKRKSFDIEKRLLVGAWEKVRANDGAPGVDAVSISRFQERWGDNLYQLWNRMSSGSYFPGPVRAVEIPKDHGAGVRVLGVPNVADRVAQTAAAMLLEARLEPIFHPASYGYRPGRSAQDAVAACRRRCWEHDWVIDCDIRAFFDSVPHDLLLKAVAYHTSKRWVLLYIERWLKAPMQMPDGTLVPREKGTPQGSPISPVLANLFMHYAFDRWMDREHLGCPFERYADDIVIHCDSQAQARQLRAAVAERLRALGLELHPEKTRIVYCKDSNRPGTAEHVSFDFLGFTFRGRLVKGKHGHFTGFVPAISAKARKAIGQTCQPSQLGGPVQPGRGHQPGDQRLDQLLRSLLPLQVALPGMAHQRAHRPMGHEEIQAIPATRRPGLHLAGAGTPAPSGSVRPLATRPAASRPTRGSRMTGDCHVRF
jgi:group II intron reverse transcriptase/maturase